METIMQQIQREAREEFKRSQLRSTVNRIELMVLVVFVTQLIELACWINRLRQ